MKSKIFLSITGFVFIAALYAQSGYAVEDHLDEELQVKKENPASHPEGGKLIHPVTGEKLDPEEGYYRDPKTGEMMDEFDLILRLGESENGCINCHYNKEEYEELTLNWDASRHSKNKVTCTKCHGGNLVSKNIKTAKKEGTNFKTVGTSLLKLKMPELAEKAFEYCGQCHGTIFRDWRAGIHGKRTGFWNGEKEYWVCLKCHNSHNPKFQKLKPDSPPIKPTDIKFRKAHLKKESPKEKNEEKH